MNIINVLNPNKNCPTIENFESLNEFPKLTLLHKTITIIATCALTILTLGWATRSYFHLLVGRFRKLESPTLKDEGSVKVSPIKQNNEPQLVTLNDVVVDVPERVKDEGSISPIPQTTQNKETPCPPLKVPETTQNIEIPLSEAIEKLQLKPLSNVEREATLGSGPFYLQPFKDMAKDYHKEGDTWSNEKLQMFFEQGLFNHYINTFLKNHPDHYNYPGWYNYTGWLKADYKDCRFDSYDREQFIKVAKLLNIETANLTKQELIQKVGPLGDQVIKFLKMHTDPKVFPKKLLQLGSLFHRQKVETEKLNHKMWAATDNGLLAKELEQQMVKKDRETELSQQLIYHWIHACVEQLFEHLKKQPFSINGFSFKDPDFLPPQLKSGGLKSELPLILAKQKIF